MDFEHPGLNLIDHEALGMGSSLQQMMNPVKYKLKPMPPEFASIGALTCRALMKRFQQSITFAHVKVSQGGARLFSQI